MALTGSGALALFTYQGLSRRVSKDTMRVFTAHAGLHRPISAQKPKKIRSQERGKREKQHPKRQEISLPQVEVSEDALQ